MTHHLIRHAQASYDEDDRVRALSARGRVQVERLCALLGPSFRPEEVWHSPLVRARETAELLVRGLGLGPVFRVRPELEPDSDPGPVAALLDAADRPILVVGHEPNLSVLASMMVRGSPPPGSLGFAKAGTMALRRGEGGRWAAEWVVRAP